VKRRSILAAAVAVCVLAAWDTGTAATRGLYTLAGTRACLMAFPHSIAGLPPAGPIGRPAVFVYRLNHLSMDSFFLRGRRPHTQLGAWDSFKYEGMIFGFFRSASAARLSLKAMTQLNGGIQVRNVVATWDGSKPRRRVRRKFLGCLRSGTPSSPGPTPQPVPAASLSTFAPGWGGHDRGLSITKAGVGHEEASAGCCSRIYDLSFQITSVSGTLIRATATYNVTAFTNYNGGPKIKVGDIGTLRLKNGIVTDMLTRDFGNFCGGVAWGASRTGGCGA
jgi:hypothetical protein